MERIQVKKETPQWLRDSKQYQKIQADKERMSQIVKLQEKSLKNHENLVKEIGYFTPAEKLALK